AVRLDDGDGALVTECVDGVFDAAVGGVVVGGGSAGVGRRAEMGGWTVGQCLAWELRDVVGQLLKLPVDRLDDAAGLRDYGFDSVSLVELAGVLGERIGVGLTPDVFFSYPSLEVLAGFLLVEHGVVLGEVCRVGRGEVSGRCPGARSVDELWGVLSEGRCVVGEVGEERGSAWGVSGVRRRLGAVPGVAEFDPLFFEVSPREAEVMDPRQRLLLQEMWRA